MSKLFSNNMVIQIPYKMQTLKPMSQDMWVIHSMPIGKYFGNYSADLKDHRMSYGIKSV